MAARPQLEDWAFISGVTAVAETRLLTDDEFLDLLRLPTLQALFQRLKQVETYVNLVEPESPDLASRAVEQDFLHHVKRYASETPDPQVAEVVLLGRRFGDVRAFIRGKLFPGEKRRRAPVFLTEAELESLWAGASDAREDLAPAVARVRAGVEKSSDPGALVDLLLDREELIRFDEAAHALGSDFISEWTRDAVRFTAALTVVRARLSGEKSEQLADTFLQPPLDDEWLLALAEQDLNRLDETFARVFPAPAAETLTLSRAAMGRLARQVDDRLTLQVREAKRVTFGPERAFGYLWGLRTENLNLRLITETLVVEAARDETRARLRLSYV